MKTTAKLFLLTLLAGLLVLPAAYAKQGPDNSALGMGNDVPVGIAVGPTEGILVFETGVFDLNQVGPSGHLVGTPLGTAPGVVNAQVAAPTMVWVQQTPWKLLGGQYQTVLIVPIVYQNIGAGGSTLGTKLGMASTGWDNMLGWKKGNFFFKGGLETWFPDATEQIAATRAAGGPVPENIAGRYWEFDPTFALTYIKSKSWEFGIQNQFWFNTTDGVTNYHSGDSYANTWTLLKTVKNAGIGLNGFMIKQFTNDTCSVTNCLGGPGVVVASNGVVDGGMTGGLAGFKATEVTLGPHFQLVTKNGIFNLKYFHDVYVRNHFGGDQFEFEWVMPLTKWISSKKS